MNKALRFVLLRGVFVTTVVVWLDSCFVCGVPLMKSQFLTCHYNDTESFNPCPLDSFPSRALIYPGGKTGCCKTKTLANASNPFYFQIQPGKERDKNKLLLFFDGGGFYTATNASNPTFTQTSTNPAPIPRIHGIFDVQDIRNPYQNWTMVLILYCSGDAHIGNKTSSDGQTRWSGRNNVKEVLKWVHTNMPNPESVVLTGASAGAFGLQHWSHSLIEHYQSLPLSPMIRVVYDAWVGFAPCTENVYELWGVCSGAALDFRWPDNMQNLCQNGDLSLAAVQRFTHASHRDVPFVFLSNKGDIVQRMYYCSTAKLNMLQCTEKNEYAAMKEILVNYTLSASPERNNVLTFWVNGIDHTIQQQPSFFKNSVLLAWIQSLKEIVLNKTLYSDCTPGARSSIYPDRSDFGCDPILTGANFSG